MGYYHGYKGYRFKGLSSDTIAFTDFSQLQMLVEFDESIKSIMYLPLMQLETTIKSICCDKIVTTIKSDSFLTVFEKAMNKNGTTKNKEITSKKLKCRNTIYSSMTRRYGCSSKIVSHFYDKDTYIPLWGIIEELTLGKLSDLIITLTPQINLAISKELGIPSNYNTEGKLLSKITSIENISFNSVIDDIVMVIFLMKNLKFNKKTLIKVVNQLISEIEKLYNKLGYDLYNKCLPFDSRDKLIKLKKFIVKKD